MSKHAKKVVFTSDFANFKSGDEFVVSPDMGRMLVSKGVAQYAEAALIVAQVPEPIEEAKAVKKTSSKSSKKSK